jgi:F-type H+-transporting ATPase subunit epsilon
MIPKAIVLDVVTPDRALVHERVDEVQMPGMNGAFGVLPGHAPLLAGLQPGEMWYRKGAEKLFLSIEFGVAEVLPNRVTVMATRAQRPEEIDVAQVESERREAEEHLRRPGSLDDAERARVAMMSAIMRLRVAERARTRRG